MADVSVGIYTSDFHSDQDKCISKKQRCTNCNKLEGNLKSALTELSSAQLIIKLLQKESHQEMILLIIHVGLLITSTTYVKITEIKTDINSGQQSLINIVKHEVNS